jgi:hypothetical protein
LFSIALMRKYAFASVLSCSSVRFAVSPSSRKYSKDISFRLSTVRISSRVAA